MGKTVTSEIMIKRELDHKSHQQINIHTSQPFLWQWLQLNPTSFGCCIRERETRTHIMVLLLRNPSDVVPNGTVRATAVE